MANQLEIAKFTIGQLARLAGVNIETVRYYQRIDLITQPDKPLQGYRKYSLQAIKDLRFIKRAQKLGFNLTEIAELLEIGNGSCDAVRRKAQLKHAAISTQIEDLQSLNKSLELLISQCAAGRDNDRCPIVDVLQQ